MLVSIGFTLASVALFSASMPVAAAQLASTSTAGLQSAAPGASALLGCTPSCAPPSVCMPGSVQSVCYDASFPLQPVSPQCPPGFATPDWDSATLPPNPLVPPLLLPRFDPSSWPGCPQLVQAELSFELEFEGWLLATNNSTLSTCNSNLGFYGQARVHAPSLIPVDVDFSGSYTRLVSIPPNGGTATITIPPTTVSYPDPSAGQGPLCFADPLVLASEFTAHAGAADFRIDHEVSVGPQYTCTLSVQFLACARVRARVVYTFCDVANPGVPFCTGDGLDPSVTTPCPCGNVGAPGHGCANSSHPEGALLLASGCPLTDSVTGTDTVELDATGLTASPSVTFVKGDASSSAGVPFFDGVRCADGLLVRLGTNPNSGGTSSYPHAGQTSLSVRGGTPIGSGSIGYYQAVYRNAAVSFCPPGTANITNGWRISW